MSEIKKVSVCQSNRIAREDSMTFYFKLVSLNYRGYLGSYWRWYNVEDPMGYCRPGIADADVNVVGKTVQVLVERKSLTLMMLSEDGWSSCRSEIVNADVTKLRRLMMFLPIGDCRRWCYVVGKADEVLVNRKSLMLMTLSEYRWSTCRSKIVDVDAMLSERPIGDRQCWC